ncbi:hypothetical protein [Porphyromonas sp.]|uniref:tetratricopeptide repeat protein n=1 Tax=Porphyromonas sp. TaxID=1924944 RepID=UPI0026DB316F|nr:hypothetical protein [Porphyromonas sp.]MDO4771185.1 hypothetical protein [Porphyromonas sp.]
MKKILLLLVLSLLSISVSWGQKAEMMRIDSLLTRSRYNEALMLVQSLLIKSPNDDVLKAKMGDILAELGDARGAVVQYERVSRDFEPREIIDRKLAIQNYRLGKHHEALGYLQSIFSRGDTTFVDCDLAGRIFGYFLEMDSAIYFQRKAVGLVPGNAGNVIRLVNNFQAIKEVDSALYYASSYLRYDSTNIALRGIRGLQYYNLNKIDSAYQDFRVAYDQGDLSPNTLYYYGLCLKAKSKFVDAKNVFLLGDTVTQGKNPWILLELGLLTQQGFLHPTSPVEYFRRAEEAMQPDSALFMKVQQGLGLSLLSEQKYGESIKHWENVLQKEPNHPQATYALGMIYGQRKNKKQEKRYYERFLKLAANDPRISKEYAVLIQNVKERLNTIKEEEFMTRK